MIAGTNRDGGAAGLHPVLRVGTAEEADRLWALRTRCVRELCSAAYPPEVIAPWAASPPPAQYAGLIAQGGCVVAEDAAGQLLGYGILDTAGKKSMRCSSTPTAAGAALARS